MPASVLAIRRRRIFPPELFTVSIKVIGQILVQDEEEEAKEDHILRPMRTSALRGEGYMKEALIGHPRRATEVLRMPLPTLRKLCRELRLQLRTSGRKDAPIIEGQVAMFIGHGWSNRAIQEHFQHNSSTVSKYIHQVLACLNGDLYGEVVELPPPVAVASAIIAENSKFLPYFKNCLGALDGSHIPAMVSEEFTARFRNRKGFLSQNVLAVCSFDCQFTYPCLLGRIPT